MAAVTRIHFIRFLLCLLLPGFLSGCGEVRALISVLFNGATSLSTSAFEFEEIRSGSDHTCAVLGDKTIRCVGSGAEGNLGTYNAGPVDSGAEVKQVVTGKEFTCVLSGPESSVHCFGRNDRGQLGNQGFVNSVKLLPVLDSENGNKVLQDVKEITAGEAHACALMKSGRAICWGDNSSGQTGNPNTALFSTHSVWESERNPKPMTGIHSIAAGANSTCIVAHEDYSVSCFGERYAVKRKVNWVPDRVEVANGFGSLSAIKTIGVGRGYGCGLAKNSQVYCWGQNDFNQLGALSNQPGLTKATAVQVTYPTEAPMSHIEDIAIGERHACAINRDEKTVFCWGDNRYGQLGNTSVRGNSEQVALGSNNLTLKGVKSLSVGPDRTCIVSVRDELFCWGNGAHGMLGNDRVSAQYPSRVLDATGEGLANISTVSVGFNHTCVLDEQHKLYCFGLNTAGQLGYQGFSGPAILADHKPLEKISSLDSYGNRTCLVSGNEQSVYCFGAREIDNLSKHPEKNSFIAEEVKHGLQSFRAAVGIATGKNKVCVIEANQGVTCVSFADAVNPVGAETIMDANQRPLRDIWQVHSREDFTCGLTQESGGIWCWGQYKTQRWPQAKLLTTVGKTSSEYIQFAMSQDQICGVRGVEHFLYCTAYGASSPEQLTLEPLNSVDGRPMKNILTISAGDHHFCAADEDGKLYCWGENESFQLGYKSKFEYQKPLLVSLKNKAIKKVTHVSAGARFTCVEGSDTPSLFCFGHSLLGGPNSIEPIEYPL